jgi:glycosyltransferase involved in cell wall biosynthesis
LGIDTKLFVNQKRPRGNLVVGIGAFIPSKNVHFIIRALAHLEPPRPRLIWIGNYTVGTYLEELTRLARSENVEFEPKLRIQDSELVDILNRASMMVYAPRLEPLGLVTLEANACGLPVVAVAEGGVRETVVDGMNGLLVEHDPPAMAAAIQRLLDHPDYARRLGENGCQAVAERWTLKHSVDRLEKRLVEILQAGAIKQPEERLISL